MATQSPLQPISDDIPSPNLRLQQRHYERVAASSIEGGNFIHTDSVYNALFNAASAMEARLKESLENYQQHPTCRRTSSSCNTTCSSGTSRSRL